MTSPNNKYSPLLFAGPDGRASLRLHFAVEFLSGKSHLRRHRQPLESFESSPGQDHTQCRAELSIAFYESFYSPEEIGSKL